MDIKLIDQVSAWIKEQVDKSGGRGVVFGLSGGVDSAVVAALCRKVFPSGRCLGVYLPCQSDPGDRADALLVARTLDVAWMEVPLDGPFNCLLESLGAEGGEGDGGLARANIKPRLRMIALYFLAALNGYRVVGTSNLSEWEVGYFTKYGDSAVDMYPLADFLKAEVQEMARLLQIPRKIIDKAPSGGLWPGQTDEGELGFTYRELDHFLQTGEAPENVRKKIVAAIQHSEHKKKMPPRFVKRGQNNAKKPQHPR